MEIEDENMPENKANCDSCGHYVYDPKRYPSLYCQLGEKEKMCQKCQEVS
jgi:hypothetical protein